MKNFLYKNKKLSFLLFILGAFFLGLFIGHKTPEISKVLLKNKESNLVANEDFDAFWKVWNTINEKSPDANKITDKERIYGAIKGLTSSLNDPYSVFFSPEEAKSFEDDISGEFSGIGAEVGIKDKILTVIAPLKDTPAYRAGLKSGDKILKIDQTITSDITVEEAIKLIRGEKGTAVNLFVLSSGEKTPKEIKIFRDTIAVPTIETEKKDGVFIIRLYSFTANSASLFRNALLEFSKSNTDKLIIDLRGNPGGYLDASVEMASWFLSGDKTVVIEDYGGKEEKKIIRSKGYDVFDGKLKLAVLIDSGSASASEILAGALQDHKVATLVGEKSFGKGSVQEVVDITPDTLLKITVAKWLTPNGKSISEEGLTPDYAVSITKKDVENNKDPQLEKAINILKKK